MTSPVFQRARHLLERIKAKNPPKRNYQNSRIHLTFFQRDFPCFRRPREPARTNSPAFSENLSFYFSAWTFPVSQRPKTRYNEISKSQVKFSSSVTSPVYQKVGNPLPKNYQNYGKMYHSFFQRDCAPVSNKTRNPR